MQKKIYIPPLIIIFFTALVFLGPRLLDVDTVRSKVAKIMSTKSGWQIDASQLDWYWLPTPHFSLHDTTLSKEDTLLTIPEIRIFPLWRSLLKQKVELKEVKLIKPQLNIDSLTKDKEQINLSLPHALVTVIDGSIVFNKGLSPEQAHLFPLTVSEIDATIYLSPDRGDFQLSSKSSSFNFMELEGYFTPRDLGYNFDYEINGLQFNKLLPAFDDDRLLPVEAAISIRGNISGNKTKQLKASVSGDFPCFVAPSETGAFLLDCGNVDLDITKDDTGFKINIKDLQLKNPAMALRGEIAKLAPLPSTVDPEPIWLLDLVGTDMDLSAIRKGVLTLWGDNHIAKTVCDIVLGGKAKQATFFFKAPLAGFRDIQQMKINVDVEEAEIHPPSTPLFLEKARGPIEINDGYLSGQGLTAKFGNSTGENCSLFLDLAGRKRDFKLDLDIDADLTALPTVLHDLIQHDIFRQELQHFSNIQGRATGHLSIGDTLTNPKVEVNINSVNGGAKYESLSHPFRIRSGNIDISPNNVNWREIRGIVGSHTIREFTGGVSWDKELALEIKSAQATFDSKALLAELNNSSALPGEIAKAVTKVEGVIELNKATMSGQITDPENWQYSFDIATSGSRWTSPLLPRPILAERVRARINREQIDLLSGKIWFLEQPLLIEGSFSHKKFSDWQFWTILTGTIREPLAEWIKEKEWIPENYFPAIPCTLDKLKVQWNNESLKLSGGIAAGMGGITSPSVRLQLESDKNHLRINKLIVSSPKEQGHLTLDYPKTSNPRLNASWQGFINAKTVNELLSINILPAERVEGDFSVKYSKSPEIKNFTGWVNAQNVDWFLNKNRHDIVIKNLKIIGEEDGLIKIDNAIIATENDELNLNGQLTMKQNIVSFDLGLEAGKINRQTVKKISEDIKTFSTVDEESKERLETPLNKQQKGVLHFKTDIFTSIPENNEDDISSYVLSPVKGFITIDSNADIYTLDLRDSKICGLDISATLNLEGSKHESSLNIFTDSSSPPLFEDVLPCFGFNKTFIEGAMHLDVNLQGTADKWQDGKADLYSDGGYIHRLGFLSKLFRVINLRDVFSGKNLPDFAKKGFAYTKVDITSHIEANKLHIDKSFIEGEGLNIFGQGTIDLGLANWEADLTVMVAPLKSVDAVITKIPLIGKVVGGNKKALLAIPASIKGDLRDPDVTILPPESIGKGFLNLITNTLMVPFQIFSPLLPAKEQ